MAAVLPAAAATGPAGEHPLPRAQQLAALGTVLCLYRPQHGSELSGWARAVRVESRADVDSDGLRESLAFFDAEDRCCWRLYLLPDSDFLAWDRMLDSLPSGSENESATGVGERLWRRLSGRLLGGQWQACVMSLHVLPAQSMAPVLAASLVPLSPLGIATAQRIAQAEGAEESIRLDDCCCARSSLAASRAIRKQETAGDHPVPLVRFTSRNSPS